MVFQVAVHRGGKMSWLEYIAIDHQGIRSQEAERYECWCLACSLFWMQSGTSGEGVTYI